MGIETTVLLPSRQQIKYFLENKNARMGIETGWWTRREVEDYANHLENKNARMGIETWVRLLHLPVILTILENKNARMGIETAARVCIGKVNQA